jgi:hypothetical protein
VFACKRKNVKRQLGQRVGKNGSRKPTEWIKRAARLARRRGALAMGGGRLLCKRRLLLRCHHGASADQHLGSEGRGEDHEPTHSAPLKGLQSMPRLRRSPPRAQVKIQGGLPGFPQTTIGPGVREAPCQTVEPGVCLPSSLGSWRPRLHSRRLGEPGVANGGIRGSPRSPHSRWNRKPGYAVGDPLLKPAKALAAWQARAARPRTSSEGFDRRQHVNAMPTARPRFDFGSHGADGSGWVDESECQ